MNDELEDLKQCMAEQGLTVDVKRETDGQIRVDGLAFNGSPLGQFDACLMFDVRDRIANALYQELSVELPAAIRGADAVIEELSLKPQSEVYKYGPIMPDGFQQALRRHRYVTEWETDETD